MPGAPFANWFAIGFLIIVAGMLWLAPDTRVALYVAPVWFALLGVGYARWKLGGNTAADGTMTRENSVAATAIAGAGKASQGEALRDMHSG